MRDHVGHGIDVHKNEAEHHLRKAAMHEKAHGVLSKMDTDAMTDHEKAMHKVAMRFHKDAMSECEDHAAYHSKCAKALEDDGVDTHRNEGDRHVRAAASAYDFRDATDTNDLVKRLLRLEDAIVPTAYGPGAGGDDPHRPRLVRRPGSPSDADLGKVADIDPTLAHMVGE
jgi:hypothetical protein